MEKNQRSSENKQITPSSSDEDIEIVDNSQQVSIYDQVKHFQTSTPVRSIITPLTTTIANIPKILSTSTSKTADITTDPINHNPLETSNQGTSTTNLNEPEKIEQLRPELNILLTVLIKQTRTKTKAEHHIKILDESLKKKTPPRGLRPKITPRIPNSKTADFIINWERTLNNCALELTSHLKDSWITTSETASTETEKINQRLIEANTTQAEWTHIMNILEKIKKQTEEDLSKKGQKRQQKQEQQAQTQEPIQEQIASTSTAFSHQQLPQRNPRKTDDSKETKQW